MLVVDPYPYQDAAIDLGLERGNLLLAYGMGLGKTLIQIGICEELLGENEVSLNAIVVPASLKWQWAQAIAWATDVPKREIRLKNSRIIVPTEDSCIVIDGTPKKREAAYRRARDNRPDYVVLGYDNVVNDMRDVRRLRPELIALDEATAIKSFGAERSLRIKQWRAPFRYALTGTPVDNRADELFSIMEWVDADELGRFDLFEKAFIIRDGYGRVKSYKHLDVLHKKTKTFVARKTRFDPDVAPYMPKDFSKDYYTRLTPSVRKLYNEIAEELIEDLGDLVGIANFDLAAFYRGDSSGGSEEQGRAASKMMALAMLTVEPSMLVRSAMQFDADFRAERPNIRGSKYLWELWHDGRLEGLKGNQKMDDVLEEIRNIVDDHPKSKVIVFSFYKGSLQEMDTRLQDMNIGFVHYNGTLTSPQKEDAKQRFKTDPSTRVFLSTDAGGMGVDLPEANYLVNFDPQWAAGKMDQRDSRHIRAGSEWDEVFILNFMVEDSIEEWKYEVLGLKRRLGSAILDGGETAAMGIIVNDVESLRNWLLSHKV